MADTVKLRIDVDAAGAQKQLQAAEQSVTKFSQAAAAGSGEVGEAASRSAFQLQLLRETIDSLRASGQNVDELEAKFKELEAQQQKNIAVAVKFRKTQEDVNRSLRAGGTVSNLGLGGLVEQYSKLIAVAGKFLVASQAVGAAFSALGRGVRELGSLYGGLDDETAELADSTEKLGRSIASLDVIETAAQLGRTLANVYIDLTNATKGAAVANDAYLASQSKARNALLGALAVQREYVQELANERQALSDRTAALVRQAQSEQQAGEVQKRTREELQALLEAYESLGDRVPESLQKVTDALGIKSQAAQDAANASVEGADREIEAAEKAALAEEARAEREAEAHAKRAQAALDAAIAKEEAAAKEAAAAEANVKKIEDELDQFAQATTPEGLEELNAELDSLRAQDILTPEQLKRLQDLEDATGSITAKTRDWRVESEKLAKQEEILDRLQQARAQALEAEDARLAALIETLQLQNQATDEAAGFTADLGGAAGDAAMSFEELERANEASLDALDRFGPATEETGDALGEFGESVGEVTDSLKDLNEETDEEGFGKMGKQVGELIPRLEQIKNLVIEIKQEAAGISLGA